MTDATTTTSATAMKHKRDSNEVLPQVPSGFPAAKVPMLVLFAVFTVVHFGVEAMSTQIISFLNLPPSADEFCVKEGNPCYRGDLLAFEVVSGLALMWCGYVGISGWHYRRVQDSVPATPEGRLFGYINEAHQLMAVSTAFQIFDFVISFLIEEQRQPIFLAHHLAAATASWYGLNNQYCHYYGVFYLGCSEISTIPLVFIDLARFFPPVPGTAFDTFIGLVCRPLFLVTFFYYRVVLWWVVCRQMFNDIRYGLKTGITAKLRPGRNHVLYVLATLNVLLGMLQLFWFGLIMKEVGKVLGVAVSES